VSIYKAEIDGVHELFRRLQRILLDSRGPWKVIWVDAISEKGAYKDKDGKNATIQELTKFITSSTPADFSSSNVVPMLMGAALGGALVASGVLLGGSMRNSEK
jgi:hypothetical protein